MDVRRVQPRPGPLTAAAFIRGATGTQRVLVLTAALFVGAIVLLSVELTGGAMRALPFPLPWPIVAGLFFVAEAKVVHLHIGRSAHSFSMSEIPLLLGLFFLDPATTEPSRNWARLKASFTDR